MKSNRLILGVLLVILAAICSGGCCAARAGAGVHVGARDKHTKWIDRCAVSESEREADWPLASPVVSVNF